MLIFIPVTRIVKGYLDYQIPFTKLKEPKGNGDIEAVKRD